MTDFNIANTWPYRLQRFRVRVKRMFRRRPKPQLATPIQSGPGDRLWFAALAAHIDEASPRGLFQ